MSMKIVGDKIYCGVDLGSSKIKSAVVRVKNVNSAELLGGHEVSTRGLQGVLVSDPQKFSESVFAAVREASQKAGVKVRDIQLGIGSDFVDHRLSQARIPLMDKGNKVVSPLDVKKVVTQARLLGIKIDEQVLHDFPQNYVLDDQFNHLNPLGLSARKLSVDLLLSIVNTIRVADILKAVHQAKLDVDNIFYNSFAAGQVSLSDRMKNDGCALIDMGASFSNVLVFKDGDLKTVFNLPIGGDHFTRSIAQNLNLPFEQADEIKKSHGIALAVDPSKLIAASVKGSQNGGAIASTDLDFSTEEVLVRNKNGYTPVQRDVICRLLEPEVSRLVNAIAQGLKNFPKEYLKAGIVIVGGGAFLAGLLERIESGTKVPVQLGNLLISGVKLSNAAAFSSAAGLSLLGFQKSFGYRLSSLNHSNWFKNFSSSVRELYQEYF